MRVRFSGVSPGDTKKRRGWLGSAMSYPRVIPHSDAAGVVDAVGECVDPVRVGRRVWVYGAQSYRPSGTAAQRTVVPSELAVDLPGSVPDELGACLGIPGITAHRAVFADGPVTGATVLVHGVLGGVGSLAAQLAHWGGATVIGTVRRTADLAQVRDAAVSYATRHDRPDFPFWPMLFNNVTICLLGSDDFPAAAKQQAATDLTTATRDGALSIAIGDPLPLEHAADAHDRVDAVMRERVVLAVPD